jgi:predicted HD superfamily hydrolase involved in NAD metabolism
MEDRERIYPAADADVFARERLSAKRYGHTLRVANTAEDLARAHGLDPGRARLAALLHDAAREMSSDGFLNLAEDLELPVGEPERESPKLLHGPVAAGLARRDLGVEDEGVLAAIGEHTTGRPGMAPLSLVLYVADKIEPARDYPSVESLRRLARRDLRAAAAESLRRSIAHNEERGRPTHPASIEALGWLEEAEEGA